MVDIKGIHPNGQSRIIEGTLVRSPSIGGHFLRTEEGLIYRIPLLIYDIIPSKSKKIRLRVMVEDIEK